MLSGLAIAQAIDVDVLARALAGAGVHQTSVGWRSELTRLYLFRALSLLVGTCRLELQASTVSRCVFKVAVCTHPGSEVAYRIMAPI